MQLAALEEWEDEAGRYAILELDHDRDTMRVTVEDNRRFVSRHCPPDVALRLLVVERNALLRAGYHEVAA